MTYLSGAPSGIRVLWCARTQKRVRINLGKHDPLQFTRVVVLADQIPVPKPKGCSMKWVLDSGGQCAVVCLVQGATRFTD